MSDRSLSNPPFAYTMKINFISIAATFSQNLASQRIGIFNRIYSETDKADVVIQREKYGPQATNAYLNWLLETGYSGFRTTAARRF